MQRVSVILPTYNRAHSIAGAVESVLNQTYRDLELVIVDDGSKDSTEEVLKKYLNDSRVRYIKQENAGAASARNRGIREARGEFVAFIDSDDVWFQDKLLIQMSAYRSFPEAGIICSDFSARLLDGREERSYIRHYFSVFDDYGLSYEAVFGRKENLHYDGELPVTAYSGWIYETMVFGNCILTSTALCKREVLDTVGVFNTSFETLEDYDLYLRITKAFPAVFVDMPLILYNFGNDQLSGESMFGKVCANLINIFRENLNSISDTSFFDRYRRRIRQHWGRIYSMSAYCHFSRDEMPEAARSYWRSILYDPTTPRYYVYLAGSLLPKGIISSIRNVKAGMRQRKKSL